MLPTPRPPSLLHLIIPDLEESTIKHYKEGKFFNGSYKSMKPIQTSTHIFKKKKKNLSTPEHLWKIYKEEGRGEVRVLNSSFKSEEKKP